MKGAYAGTEGVTVQASKLFVDPLDGKERNIGLISQENNVPDSKPAIECQFLSFGKCTMAL